MAVGALNAHPLVTIRFEMIDPDGGPLTTQTRHWYHVPCVGDEVSLGDALDDDKYIDGRVEMVSWRDRAEGEPDVVVRVK